jgi:uroporphyrinogen decarboxylase
VFETVTQAMGLQTFCVSLYDRPELVTALFERTGNLISQCIERMLQFDSVGAIWITDDLAYNGGTLISPHLLRRYVFPWYKKYTEMVHSRGLPVLLHTCGNPSAIFQEIIEAGFDALHPLEATSVDIYEAKRQIGDRICLCGNLDLGYVLTRGTTDEVVEDVKNHLRRLAPGGGYCLGSSNSIPNYVPMDRYLAMNRTCLERGKYPICL